MRIYLLNDTSAEHAGCRAVMRSLRAACAGHEILATHRVGEFACDEAALAACDALLVNGEGTIHHRAPKGDFLMEVLRRGQEMGKKTLLVNALFQQEPPYYEDVLENLDFFAVREPRSAACARACGGNPVVLLDSCTGVDLSEGRGLGVEGPLFRGDTHPESPLHGLLDALPISHLGLGGNFEDVAATLRSASLYVTGQHHGVIAAGLAGVPFVALESNSHEIESLLEWSGLPIRVCRTMEDVREQMAFAMNSPDVFRRFHDFLMSQRPFGRADLEEILSASTRRVIAGPRTDASETAPARLRRVIGGRAVGVLLHGPSVQEMKERIREFADLDFSWCSLNFFSIMERDILSQIGRGLDFIYCMSEEEVPRRLGDIEAFLARSPEKVLITTRNAMEGLGGLARRFRGQIVFMPRPDLPDEKMPNSLTFLLRTLVSLEAAPRIALFGADGLLDSKADPIETYFGKETLRRENRENCLVQDTLRFNEEFGPELERLYAETGARRVEIVNCNPRTHLTPLPIISYDDLGSWAARAMPCPAPARLRPEWAEAHERSVEAFLADEFSIRPRRLRSRHRNHVVVYHNGRFHALPEEFAGPDGAPVPPAKIEALAGEGVVLTAPSLDALRSRMDAADAAATDMGTGWGPETCRAARDSSRDKSDAGGRGIRGLKPAPHPAPNAKPATPQQDTGALEHFQWCLQNGKPYFGPVMAARQGAPVRHAYMTEAVARLARERGGAPLQILEIGSWAGGSAITWAAALKKHNAGQGRVLCVDPWEVYYDAERENARSGEANPVYAAMTEAARSGAIFDLFRHNIRSAGHEDAVLVLKARGEDAAPLLADGAFDIVFVDGVHTYQAVADDLRRCARLVRQGGILCGDDLEVQMDEADVAFARAHAEVDYLSDPRTGRHYHPGVTLAVGEFFGPVSSWEGFWAARRTADGWAAFDMPRLDAAESRVPEHLLDRPVPPPAPPPPPKSEAIVLDEDYNGYTLFCHDAGFYAVAVEVGLTNPSAVGVQEMKEFRARGLFLEASSVAALKKTIDAASGNAVVVTAARLNKGLVLGCATRERTAEAIGRIKGYDLTLLVPSDQTDGWNGVKIVPHRGADGRPRAEFDLADIPPDELAALKAERFDTAFVVYADRMLWGRGCIPERLAAACARRVEILYADGERRVYEGEEDLNRIGYNRAYLDNLFRHVPDLTGLSILEVGCSDGLACDLVARAGARRVVGVDVCATPGARFPREGVEYRRMSADRLEFADGEFDVVFSIAVLEHCPNPRAALEEMRRVLKPDGALYVQTAPLYCSPFGHHMFGYFDDLPWIHLRATPEEIIAEAERRGLGERIRAERGQDAATFIRGMLSRAHVNMLRLAEYGFAEFIQAHDVNVLHVHRSTEGEDLLTPQIIAELADYDPYDLVTHGIEVVCRRSVSGERSELTRHFAEIIRGEYVLRPKSLGSQGGYNIVQYQSRIYAIPVSLGPVDLTRESDRARPGILCADRRLFEKAGVL